MKESIHVLFIFFFVLISTLIFFFLFKNKHFGVFSPSVLLQEKEGRKWWFATLYDEKKDFGIRVMFLFPSNKKTCWLEALLFNSTNFTRFLKLYDSTHCFLSKNKTLAKIGKNWVFSKNGKWYFVLNLSSFSANLEIEGKNGFYLSLENTSIVIPLVNSTGRVNLTFKTKKLNLEGISYLEFISTDEPNPSWIWGYFENGKISMMVVNATSNNKKASWVVIYDGKFYSYFNRGKISKNKQYLQVEVNGIELQGIPLNDFIMKVKGKVFGKKFEGLGFYEFV